jgi:hypothetical protein
MKSIHGVNEHHRQPWRGAQAFKGSSTKARRRQPGATRDAKTHRGCLLVPGGVT